MSSGLSKTKAMGFEQQSEAAPKEQETTLIQDFALSQGVNNRERDILESNGDIASGWVKAAAAATTVSGAYAATTEDSGRSTYLGKADALRHCLWNAIMAYQLGPEMAEQLANAHELERPPQEVNARLDREMDLHNNRVGRNLGETLLGEGLLARALALPFLIAAAKDALDSGQLKVIDQSTEPWTLVSSSTDKVP